MKIPLVDVSWFPGKKGKRLDPAKWLDYMRWYVQKKLEETGVIPEQECNPLNPYSLAANIISDAMRSPSSAPEGEQLPCILAADGYIEQAAKYPPEPITKKYFSLRAFVNRQH